MAAQIRTFIEHFGQIEGFASGKEPLLEYVSTFTHEGKTGYLFKDLNKDVPIFLGNDEVFSGQPPSPGIYMLHGFATDSSVPLIESKQAA